jgi:hypothetical protein
MGGFDSWILQLWNSGNTEYEEYIPENSLYPALTPASV